MLEFNKEKEIIIGYSGHSIEISTIKSQGYKIKDIPNYQKRKQSS